MSGPGPRGSRYLLGHTETELRRLDLQDELYRDATVRALRDGGVREGMRVLDLGCGTGAVSVAAAELVGPLGYVLGIDREARGLEIARAHARSRGLSHVDFEVREIASLAEADAPERAEPFDALVGRFVLMHQPDPAGALRAACRVLTEGGRVVMIESFMRMLEAGVHSVPDSPLYDRLVRWKSAVVRGAGADVDAGARLRRTFVEAGLPAPTTRLEARLEAGSDSPYYRYVAESVRSMLPEAERLGLDGFTEADADDLEERLRAELLRTEGVLIAWPVVAAWAGKGVRRPEETC